MEDKNAIIHFSDSSFSFSEDAICTTLSDMDSLDVDVPKELSFKIECVPQKSIQKLHSWVKSKDAKPVIFEFKDGEKLITTEDRVNVTIDNGFWKSTMKLSEISQGFGREIVGVVETFSNFKKRKLTYRTIRKNCAKRNK